MPRTTYLRFRRLVDYDLANNRRPFSLLGVLPGVAILAIAGGSWLGWLVGLGLAVVWLSFIGWRSWRLMKTAALRGDRAYDRIGKFALPSEYAATESATSARRRLRIGRSEQTHRGSR